MFLYDYYFILLYYYSSALHTLAHSYLIEPRNYYTRNVQYSRITHFTGVTERFYNVTIIIHVPTN